MGLPVSSGHRLARSQNPLQANEGLLLSPLLGLIPVREAKLQTPGSGQESTIGLPRKQSSFVPQAEAVEELGFREQHL